MKNLIPIYLLLALSFFGCERTDNYPPREYNYSVVNSTDKTVTIIPVMGTTPDLANKIVIAPGAKMQKSFSDKAPYDGYNMSTMLFESVMVDKAIVCKSPQKLDTL